MRIAAGSSGVSTSLTSRLRSSLKHRCPPAVVGHPLRGSATCPLFTAEHFAAQNPVNEA